jgi:hypothetical protein
LIFDKHNVAEMQYGCQRRPDRAHISGVDVERGERIDDAVERVRVRLTDYGGALALVEVVVVVGVPELHFRLCWCVETG